MPSKLVWVAFLLPLVPLPVWAGGSGPGIGSPVGIIVIVVALVIGFFIGRFYKKT